MVQGPPIARQPEFSAGALWKQIGRAAAGRLGSGAPRLSLPLPLARCWVAGHGHCDVSFADHRPDDWPVAAPRRPASELPPASGSRLGMRQRGAVIAALLLGLLSLAAA